MRFSKEPAAPLRAYCVGVPGCPGHSDSRACRSYGTPPDEPVRDVRPPGVPRARGLSSRETALLVDDIRQELQVVELELGLCAARGGDVAEAIEGCRRIAERLRGLLRDDASEGDAA